MSPADTYLSLRSRDRASGDHAAAAWSREAVERGIGAAALDYLAHEHIGSQPSTWDASLQGMTVSGPIGGTGALITVTYSRGLSPESLANPEGLALRLMDTVPRRDHLYPGFDRAGYLPVYPSEIDGLADGQFTLAQLLTTKLVRAFTPELSRLQDLLVLPTATELRDLRQDSIGSPELVSAGVSIGIEHPKLDQLLNAVRRSSGVLLVGHSASGKSTLLAQIAQRLAAQGSDVAALDFSANPTYPLGVMHAFILRRPGADVFLIDDAQSQPVAARVLLALPRLIDAPSDGSTPPTILVSSWPEHAAALKGSPGVEVVEINGNDLASDIIRQSGVQAEAAVEIAEAARGDLVLLSALLDQSGSGLASRIAAAGTDMWEQLQAGAEQEEASWRRVLLVAAAAGRRDIALRLDPLADAAGVGRALSSRMVEQGVLRLDGSYVRLGHRARCALLVDTATVNGWWAEGESYGFRSETEALARYIALLPASEAIEILRSVSAKSGLPTGSNQLNDRATAILRTWQGFRRLMERVAVQHGDDPTWGATPSSCMFVSGLFSEIGDPEASKPTLEFLRSHWQVLEGELQVGEGAFSTVADFREISRSMSEQDEEFAPEEAGWDPAADIDPTRMHRTWLGGVLLSAEAAAPDSRRAELAPALSGWQLESGAFYPERVPWVTARVLLALGDSGLSYSTDDTVRGAADWLLRDHAAGGARRAGVWHSGTGEWNSTTEVTAMVMNALAAVGVDCTGTDFAESRRLLTSHRSRWNVEGAEVDAAEALKALLSAGGSLDELVHDVNALAERSTSESLWRSATLSASDSLGQSCKAAQVASSLVSIGWSSMRRNLPEFLGALDNSLSFVDSIAKGQRS